MFQQQSKNIDCEGIDKHVILAVVIGIQVSRKLLSKPLYHHAPRIPAVHVGIKASPNSNESVGMFSGELNLKHDWQMQRLQPRKETMTSQHRTEHIVQKQMQEKHWPTEKQKPYGRSERSLCH